MADDAQTQWYWCLDHRRAERFGECRGDRQLGPYASVEDAQRWQERVEARNKRWDDEDKRWNR
jgi:hypothetical protein